MRFKIDAEVTTTVADRIVEQLTKELGVTVTFEPVHPLEDVNGWEEMEVVGRAEYTRAVDRIIELKRGATG